MLARQHQRAFAAAVASALGAAACAHQPPAHQAEVRACADLVMVSPGDEPYRFKAGDTFRVSVRTAPELNAERIIAPDGSVNLPLIGYVTAAGRSNEDLQASLEDLYAAELRDPSLQIAAVAFSDLNSGKRTRRCAATVQRW